MNDSVKISQMGQVRPSSEDVADVWLCLPVRPNEDSDAKKLQDVSILCCKIWNLAIKNIPGLQTKDKINYRNIGPAIKTFKKHDISFSRPVAVVFQKVADQLKNEHRAYYHSKVAKPPQSKDEEVFFEQTYPRGAFEFIDDTMLLLSYGTSNEKINPLRESWIHLRLPEEISLPRLDLIKRVVISEMVPNKNARKKNGRIQRCIYAKLVWYKKLG